MNNLYIIAHRGVTEKGLKENTFKSLTAIKSFRSDINLGIEFDIQLTADNKIIIFHDEKINNNIVEHITYSEILDLDKDIIELEKLIIEFDNTKFLLNIELKNYSNKIDRLNIFTNKLKEIISKYNINFYCSSFDINICKIIDNCYFISEDIEEKNVNFTEYYYISKFNNLVGVYTLFDKYNFDTIYIDEAISKNINYLITDNVEKLIKYLYKDKFII